MAITGLRNLCTPSYLYLIISIVMLVVMAIQNMGSVNVYCLGSYSCDVSSVYLIFMIKIIYVLFWTWILNLMCRSGATGVAWFFFLLPFILLFIMIALMMVVPL
jgi:hypothetical protein